MNILVIDTSTEACSVALEVKEQVFKRFEVCPQQHSQRILPMIDEVLKEANVTLQDLDYLGFGLPPPTPSLGELLKQGTSTLRTAPWIVTSSFGTLVVILTLVTFVGEAIRESFDPKKFTIYR